MEGHLREILLQLLQGSNVTKEEFLAVFSVTEEEYESLLRESDPQETWDGPLYS